MPVVVALVLINVGLLILALYFIQEGEAQRAHPDLRFFVDFPVVLLPLAYAAALLLIPNFAVTAFVLARNLYRRRWPWVTTFVSAVLLAVITAMVGWDGVATIIKPGV
ncbi:MAG: hypothetical protein M3N59_02020 [bacterium]|nr:hypothetical protein [bacterium]